MATITVNVAAYRRLAAEKRKGESFSSVIMRLSPHKRERMPTARDFLKNLNKVHFSEEMLDNVDRLIAARNESLADSPILDSED